jgi:hypothetical protein
MQMAHTSSSRGGSSGGGAGEAVEAEDDSFWMLAANPAYAKFMICVFCAQSGISFKEAKLLVIAAVLARRLSLSWFDKKISRTSAGLRGATDSAGGGGGADSNVLLTNFTHVCAHASGRIIMRTFSFWRSCEILHSKSGFAAAELLLEIVQVRLQQEAKYLQEHLRYCPMQRRGVQDFLRVQRLHVIQSFRSKINSHGVSQ